MKNIALQLPGGNTIPGPSGLKPEFVGPDANLASIISPLLQIAFYIAAFLAFYWLIWGAYQYIMSRGEKENLAKARAKITWALVGLMVVFMAYFIAKFAAEVFPPLKGGLPNPSGAPF